jgi:hypothetical protein
MKTSETKKFVKIFCEAFLIFKKYCVSTIQDYFHFYKRDFLNTQAVRIRVNRAGTKKLHSAMKISGTVSFCMIRLRRKNYVVAASAPT